MDRLLEQKRKGQQNFRLKINQFISHSNYAKKQQQLTTPIINELLQNPLFQSSLLPNGKVSIQKLSEKLCKGQQAQREFIRVVGGGRRQLKPSDLHNILKSYQLHEFNLEEELIRYTFQNGSMSLKKLDELMINLNMPVLNAKDREILVECFDFDRDGGVGRDDLSTLMELCSADRKQEDISGNGSSVNNNGGRSVGGMFRIERQ